MRKTIIAAGMKYGEDYQLVTMLYTVFCASKHNNTIFYIKKLDSTVCMHDLRRYK